ncbi:MAG: YhbY family RNA-binding protein, partial [Candidatus Hodarchaeota archaeon]
GLSESMLTYMKERLKHVEVLKVRVLKSMIVDKNTVKDLASEVAKKLNAKVKDVRGNTFVLSR